MQSLVSSSTAAGSDARFPVDLCLPLIGLKDFLP